MLFRSKGNSKNDFHYFSYPNLAFQTQSLYECWEEIVRIQAESGEDISKAVDFQRNRVFFEDHSEDDEDEDNTILDISRNSYGNKPNLSVHSNAIDKNTIQLEEERKAFPIAVDFKYEYNSFRRKVIFECKRLTGKHGNIKNQDVIFVQTDIIKFFHNLQIEPLAGFIEEQFPFAKNLVRNIQLLDSRFRYETLPIGWVMSRFISNIVIQRFHKIFNKHLQRNLKNSLDKRKFEIEPDQSIDLSSEWPVELVECVSYVDDFIFLLTVPSKSSGVSEKIVANVLLREANSLLNQAITGNGNLNFHAYDSEKTKVQRFTRDNISTLKTNFTFFNTADDYLTEDPEIRARIDDILLPADNDIILNSSQQFHRHLKGVQKSIIANRATKEKQISDLLGQIKIKVEKTGSKYIRSVFGLLRLLILSDLPDGKKKKIRTSEIKQLFAKCKKSHNYSGEWIKFFGGYFNFLSSIDYEDIDLFFKLLSEATREMSNRSIDDRMIFRMMRNEYLYNIILASPGKSSLKSKVLGELKKSEGNLLLSFSNQRGRSIHFIVETIRANTHQSNSIIARDMCWIGNVINQLHYRRIKINSKWLLNTLNKLSKTAEDILFDYGLARIAIGYLPFSGNSERVEFIAGITKFNLTYKAFWKIAAKLVEGQDEIANYYKTNESGRIERILNCLEAPDQDFLFRFIKPCFKSDQYRLCSYLITSRFNNESEFIKYILSSRLILETDQLAPWSVIPMTFQKTGIAISLVLKELFEMELDTEAVIAVLGSDAARKLKESTSRLSSAKLSRKPAVEEFGVNIVDLDLLIDTFEAKEFKEKPFKITIAPLAIDIDNSLDFKQGFRYHDKNAREMDIAIRAAIDEAVRNNSSIVLFPELCLPRRYLNSYLKLISGHKMVLVAGLEYYTDFKGDAYNSTVISVPAKRHLNPGGREYFAFEQIKNFPAAEENFYLQKAGFRYMNGNGIYIFKSKFWSDFAVLTCSDFLSLGLRWIIQGEIQSVFVPAQNNDSVTYDHISETCIRDLHALAIVCNNPTMGGSHCYAPYYDRRKRQVFKKSGISHPEFHTFEIQPKTFRNTQENADPIYPFRNPDDKGDEKWGDYRTFKQLPPDWEFWKN